MRTFIGGLVLAALAVSGCATKGGESRTTPAGTIAERAGNAKACVMQAGGRDVLRLTVPVNTTSTAKDGALHLESHDHEAVDVWLVRGARTVEEAIPRVPETITSEFKGYTATNATTLTVAGEPGRRMLGSGTEADDGDPGTADVIVFRTGDRVFVACTHAESLLASAQKWMLVVVQTAQKP